MATTERQCCKADNDTVVRAVTSSPPSGLFIRIIVWIERKDTDDARCVVERENETKGYIPKLERGRTCIRKRSPFLFELLWFALERIKKLREGRRKIRIRETVVSDGFSDLSVENDAPAFACAPRCCIYFCWPRRLRRGALARRQTRFRGHSPG